MKKISLFDRLHIQNKKAKFTWQQKLSILYQTACACLFLHQQGIVHRDIKSSVSCIFNFNFKFNFI